MHPSKERPAPKAVNTTSLAQFLARDEQRQKNNQMLIDRIWGMPAQPATPESDADPNNPSVK